MPNIAGPPAIVAGGSTKANIAAFVFALAAAFSLLGYHIWKDYQDAVRDARTRAENLSTLALVQRNEAALREVFQSIAVGQPCVLALLEEIHEHDESCCDSRSRRSRGSQNRAPSSSYATCW